NTNKVVAHKSYSRQCSKCYISNYKPHSGRCQRNFDGTAKSMEPKGMIACLKQVKEKGYTIHELVLDNDGNTIEAIKSGGFGDVAITRDKNHTIKGLTGKVIGIFPTPSVARAYYISKIKKGIAYGQNGTWLSQYYNAVVEHSRGNHNLCTKDCNKGKGK
ncbi:unnamed protein product, partial [Meganyctiphanes norvegica]